MFCTRCGSNVPEGVKFCTECGNPVAHPAASAGPAPAPGATPTLGIASMPNPSAPQPAPGYAPAPNASFSPQPQPKKKSRGPLIAGIVAIVAVVAIVAGGFATNWFGLARGPLPFANPMGNKSVYVVTSRTQYDSDGEKLSKTKRTLDGNGNLTKLQSTTYTDGDITYETTTNYTCDDNGYPIKATRNWNDLGQTSGNRSRTTQYESEFDAARRLIKQVATGDDGSVSTTTFEYHANGQLKKERYDSEDDDYTSTETYEYDENGYLIKMSVADEGPDDYTSSSEVTTEWEFDSNSNPVSYTIKGTYEDSYSQKTQHGKVTYTVDVDEHGNITAVYDEKGNLLSELTYERIDNPSRYAADTNTKGFYYGIAFN